MRNMKDSGVAWIGEIPSDWALIRFKDKYKNTKEIAKEQASNYERLALTLGGVVKRPKDDSEGLQPKEFDGYQILRENDFIFKMIDLQNVSTSRVGLSPYTGLVSPAYIRFSPKRPCQYNRFVYYFLMSLYYNQVFNNLGGNGVRSALSSKDIGEFLMPYPSENEQQKICALIDNKIERISRLISNVQEQIEKLKAYKQSLITEVVTKGLDPTVPMKDSGVDWIGEIPESWNVTISKAVFENVSERNHPDATVLSLYRDLGVVPKDSRDDNHNVTSENTTQYKFVARGNLVINKMKAWQGSLAVSNYNGIVSPAYYVCRFRNNIMNKEYAHYLLRSNLYAQQFECLSTGMRIGQWDLSIDDFLATLLLVPPESEQTAIASYLDRKCNEIDQLIAVKQAKIEKLEQYKRSLIYEYVTGKKEVF